jgi:hypothetical protein
MALLLNRYPSNFIDKQCGRGFKKLNINQPLTDNNYNITQVNNVRRDTAGMQPKILGSWKQYSGREFFGLFSVDSDKFQCFLAGSGDFPASFLQDPVQVKVPIDYGEALFVHFTYCLNMKTFPTKFHALWN